MMNSNPSGAGADPGVPRLNEAQGAQEMHRGDFVRAAKSIRRKEMLVDAVDVLIEFVKQWDAARLVGSPEEQQNDADAGKD